LTLSVNATLARTSDRNDEGQSEAHLKRARLPLARLVVKGISGRSPDPRHLIVGNAQMEASLLNSSGELRSPGRVQITPIACSWTPRRHDLTDAA
jgi:hypothetical protein